MLGRWLLNKILSEQDSRDRLDIRIQEEVKKAAPLEESDSRRVCNKCQVFFRPLWMPGDALYRYAGNYAGPDTPRGRYCSRCAVEVEKANALAEWARANPDAAAICKRKHEEKGGGK